VAAASTRDARRFLVTFLIGLVIGVAPLVAVTARLAAIGELDLFDSDGQLVAEELHGPVSESFAEYKLRMTSALTPETVILGSSRVMQFRDALFAGCGARICFYNAGGAATTMLEALEYVRSLPRTPRLILLGLDVWQFNPNDATNTHQSSSLRPSGIDRVRRAIGTVRQLAPRIYADEALRSLVVLGEPASASRRGARAILRGEGFRPDGSYAYGPALMSDIAGQTPAARSADALDRVARGCCRFERFTEPDQQSLAELEQLVVEVRAKGATVVAFMPPYADLVSNAVDRDAALSVGFARVRDALRGLLSRRGIPFVDFARASSAGCDSAEMLDGLHPSEVCSARVLDRLLANDDIASALRPYTTAGHVRTLLSAAPSALSIGVP